MFDIHVPDASHLRLDKCKNHEAEQILSPSVLYARESSQVSWVPTRRLLVRLSRI